METTQEDAKMISDPSYRKFEWQQVNTGTVQPQKTHKLFRSEGRKKTVVAVLLGPSGIWGVFQVKLRRLRFDALQYLGMLCSPTEGVIIFSAQTMQYQWEIPQNYQTFALFDSP